MGVATEAERVLVEAAPGRPPVRYHGGKWRLATWILKHFPRHRVYVEPFCGGASVLFRKPRSYAEIINDLDDEIVNVFRVLRDPASAADLARLLELTPYARAEFNLGYVPAADPVERARRTIARSAMAFGSVSVNASRTGFKSVVHSSRKNEAINWRAFPGLIPLYTDRLRGVVIENRDAYEIMRQHDRVDTLHYCDPPYPLSTRPGTIRGKWEMGRAYRYELLDDDHRGLANILRSLAGMVILSGYPCELYDRELYPDWKRVEKRALADGARERVEVLWLNPAAAAALQEAN